MLQEGKIHGPTVRDNLAEAPYEMEINVPALEAFLRGLHIRKKTRRGLVIELGRKFIAGNSPYSDRVGGGYDHSLRHLWIFGDPVYKAHAELFQIVRDREALGLVEGGFRKAYRRRHEQELPDSIKEIYRGATAPVFRFLESPRFITYLKRADKQRVDRFLHRQENIAMDRITKEAFFHELGHLVQSNRNDKKSATIRDWYIGLLVTVVTGVSHFIFRQVSGVADTIWSLVTVLSGMIDSGLLTKYFLTKPESNLMEERESEAIAFSREMMKTYHGPDLITAKIK